MTGKTPEIGDTVAWADVPDGALIRDRPSDLWAETGHAVRLAGRGRWVHEERVLDWSVDEDDWPWHKGEELGQGADGVTVVALGLTGRETADELQRVTELFEVREALTPWRRDDGDGREQWIVTIAWPGDHTRAEGRGETPEAARDIAADRLYRAGWRAGDGPERAAELLTRAPA
jgi:hypothetical protein